jgi:hypothetical protein
VPHKASRPAGRIGISNSSSGQWIDITGVSEGDYIVHVEINAAHTFPEGANRYSNVIETTIHLPDPRNKVAIDNSPAATD